MVIITTMVAKIYFPESLERGISGMEQARTFNYRVAEGDDYYGSDDDEEGMGGADTESSGAGNQTDDDNDDDNEILDSDPENNSNDDHNEEEDALLTTDTARQEGNNDADDLLFEMRPSSSGKVSGKRRGVSFANKKCLEFEQMSLSKAEVMKRLSICVIMLNLTFVTWGVLQVRIVRR